jgi:alkanesulfonate monooxygenase SsuD/methylene tetrahydromethanopterin reductase-like flavin-dependent oxidoreductase (luciferase family)
MLQIGGEIADGVLLTWPTTESGRRAADNVAAGARRAGRAPGDVADDMARIKAAFDSGDRAAAERLVPDALIGAISAAGTPEQCREKVAAYRGSGIGLPIISPRARGPEGKQMALAALRACAP